MTQSESGTPGGDTGPHRLLARFTPGERWVHRSLAVLMAICLITAACLYIGPIAVLVGRRGLFKTLHVYAGLALPLPILIGLTSRAFRNDLGRFNRFTPADWTWLRSKDRRTGRVPIGKFNPGQKLNAAFIAAPASAQADQRIPCAILVLLGSGVILGWPDPWPLSIRQGATFVHDWLAAAVVIMIAGHLWFASHDPIARAGLRTGFVPADWAEREHPSWLREEGMDSTSGTVGP